MATFSFPNANSFSKKIDQKSWTLSGTRSMEPHNNHSRSNEESTMSNTLPDLSNLPDLVLVSILSLMDPKEAVQTCILSKRWRNLWTCIPSLNFYKGNFKGTNDAFVHFVSSMLSLRGASKLDTFRLRWYASQDEANSDSEERKAHVIVANAWIYTALSCKPLVISLNLHGFDNSKLPPALFRCASLKHLELHLSCRSNGEAAEYKYVNLPSLKKLKFGRFIINDPFMQGILSGCPLLEELELCACSLNFSEMKSDHLRCLNILACQGSGSGVVEIFMPSLVSLQFKNFYPGVNKLSFKSTPSLVKVLVWCDSFSVAEVELFNCSTTVIDLGLFGSGAEGLLQKIVLKCPIFDSLKQLTVGQWSINENLDLLCQFLQHTPNLEKLTIIDKEDSVLKRHILTGKAEKKGATGQIPFRCDQLKAIEIKYSDLTGVPELVDTLLQNISRRSVSVVYTKLQM
ncbi:hypothetical protein LUZ63_011527 [Rhynchospora breviuscula]|uniref:F-box domain-containing protein n=1 Tax=Rhynchospora breviuscula TaxID=2022672 RepID=A0A9Q0HQL9_9POAL|nr:hypothetical protein LUZ63_011527 [Rhynchospora breviuscula]